MKLVLLLFLPARSGLKAKGAGERGLGKAGASPQAVVVRGGRGWQSREEEGQGQMSVELNTRDYLQRLCPGRTLLLTPLLQRGPEILGLYFHKNMMLTPQH